MVYMEDGRQTRDGHHERHSLEEVGYYSTPRTWRHMARLEASSRPRQPRG
jgi:hypothetical protein